MMKIVANLLHFIMLLQLHYSIDLFALNVMIIINVGSSDVNYEREHCPVPQTENDILLYISFLLSCVIAAVGVLAYQIWWLRKNCAEGDGAGVLDVDAVIESIVQGVGVKIESTVRDELTVALEALKSGVRTLEIDEILTLLDEQPNLTGERLSDYARRTVDSVLLYQLEQAKAHCEQLETVLSASMDRLIDSPSDPTIEGEVTARKQARNDALDDVMRLASLLRDRSILL